MYKGYLGSFICQFLDFGKKTMKKAIIFSLLLGLVPYNNGAIMVDTLTESGLMDYVLNPFKREDIGNFLVLPPPGYSPSNNPDDIYFYLYNNPKAIDQFNKIAWNDCSALNALPWIKHAPIKVLIHGFTQSQNGSMPAMVKNAYLDIMNAKDGHDVNVVVVDWGRLAGSLIQPDINIPIYTRAVRNVAGAGIRTGELLANLWKCGVVTTMDNIHVVGFSLGAHVAGWAGKTVADLVSPIGRITGLDPAGPLFYANITGFTGRDLTKDDAQHVDVIHTSWGTYGIARVVGNADFFPNFLGPPVQTQPFCARVLNTLRPLQVCSHNMAPVYFSMSILRDLFSCRCDRRILGVLPTLSPCVPDIRSSHCEPSTFGEFWEPTNTGSFHLLIPKRLLQESETYHPQIDNLQETQENSVIRDYGSPLYHQKSEVFGRFLGVELVPQNREQVIWINRLRNIPGYLFWSGQVTIHGTVSIFVPDAARDQFMSKVNKIGFGNNIRFYQVRDRV